MAILIGRNSKVCIGNVTIAELADFSFTLEAPLLEAETFSTDFTRVAGAGIMSAGGSVSGLTSDSDTTGQDVISAAVLTNSGINNFRLYISDSEYWSSDTATDEDATCYFTNLSLTAAANDITKISFDYKFHSNVSKTTV